MSMIGSHRLVNAIENGSYATHGDLTTALATTRTRVEFQGAVRNTTLLTRLMSNQVAVPLILDSTTASTDLFNSNSDVLCSVLPNSYEFMKAVVTTTTRFDKLKTVPGMMNALHRSDMAVTIINTDAIGAVFSTFPLHYTSVDVDVAGTYVSGVVYSSLYKTTVAITNKSILTRSAWANNFTKVLAFGGSAINDIAANSDGSIIVVASSTNSSSGLVYSTDGGNTWTNGGTSGSFVSVIFGSSASLFIALASTGTIYSSSNGSSWTSRSTHGGSGPAYKARARAYGGGLYVFPDVGANNMGARYSTDGVAWTSVTFYNNYRTDSQAATSIAVSSDGTNIIIYAGGIASTSGNYSWYASSTDSGATWSDTKNSNIDSTYPIGVAAAESGSTFYTGNYIGSSDAGTTGDGFDIATASAAGMKAWPTVGRGKVLYTTGSVAVTGTTELINSTGGLITTTDVVPPCITGNGIYFPDADGALWCSNIAKTT